jgi:hypothetical protein
MKSAFIDTHNEGLSIAAMRLGNCEIHLCRTVKRLHSKECSADVGEMAEATDLKYAAMPRSNL